LEQPLPASAPGTVRRRQLALITTAQAACRECPLIIDCLYRAVVEYDVAGYVAGTTAAQRAQIRRRLDVTWSLKTSTASPESLAAIARSTTARSCAYATPTPTRAWRRWRSGSAVRFQRLNDTSGASVDSPRRVPLTQSPASQRWLLSLPLLPAHRSYAAAHKRPDSA
jgi:hypothetical protein